MNFTLSTIASSLAAYLAPTFPGVTFYEDPNQQGTQLPCFFLQQRYNQTSIRTGGYFFYVLGLDLTYLQEYNLPNRQQLYEQAAGALDLVMETFPYSDGTSSTTTLIRTYDRGWTIDKDALHYKFELHLRVSIPESAVKMQTIESYNQEVTE